VAQQPVDVHVNQAGHDGHAVCLDELGIGRYRRCAGRPYGCDGVSFYQHHARRDDLVGSVDSSIDDGFHSSMDDSTSAVLVKPATPQIVAARAFLADLPFGFMQSIL